MKKSLFGLLFASLISFSAGGCSSGSAANEASAEWQKDVAAISLADNPDVGYPTTATTYPYGSTHDGAEYIWCKEWAVSGGSGAGLTFRVKYADSDGYTEKKCVGCPWAITRSMETWPEPGGGWSDEFSDILIPGFREYYHKDYLETFMRGLRFELSSVWYKESAWEQAKTPCLTVRYKGTFGGEPFVYETKYVGCRYIIDRN